MTKLLACLLAAALLTAPVQAQQLQPIERIAAVVDDDVILQSELDRAVGNILRQYASQPEQLPPRDVLERQVLERLVLLELQVARAEATGIRVSDQEVDETIAAIAGQNQLSVAQLRDQVAAEGSTFAQFRASMRDEMLVQRLRQRFAQSEVAVTEAEVDAALTAQPAAGAQFHLAHILVALPEGATAAQIQTAAEKIEGIRSLLEQGKMDFAAAAVRYSDSPNALEGGDLGWRDASEIPRAFADMVRAMDAGDVTAPIRGPSGFQLLQLVGTRDSAEAPAQATQYHARHILIRVDADTSDAQAKAEADTLRARIAGGAEFAEIAREHSQDPSSKDRGGDLGWFVEQQFGPDFGRPVAALQDGEISPPFRTQSGWHIVERLGSRQSEAGSDRRMQVRETIGRRKLEEQWNRFVSELRGEAFVDVRTGTPDPATTPAPATPPASAPPAATPADSDG